MRRTATQNEKMRKNLRGAWLPLLLATLALGACTDKETEIGLGLTDPATLYNGKTDTITAVSAFSVRDDSLITSNYSYGIIGDYTDPVFGRSTSTLFSQIGLASGMSSINFDEVTIDSVVLNLVSDGLFPDTTGSYNLHFVVRQLAAPINADSDYYSIDSIPVDMTATFFDQTVTVGTHDTVVRLSLAPAINSVLAQTGASDEFLEATKGLAVSIVGDADQGMFSINFATTATCLTAHYHYGTDTIPYTYDFLFGGGVAHFTHFTHDYSGTIFDGNDSLDGSQQLYLQPLAGFNALINFDSAIRAFHESHKLAVIHHAELLLPVAPTAPAELPGQLVALASDESGVLSLLPDYTDAYTYRGFDGTYDNNRNLYRIRITQYLQRLLRQGTSGGINVLLDARRSSALRTILTGPEADNKPRIVFVYTE